MDKVAIFALSNYNLRLRFFYHQNGIKNENIKEYFYRIRYPGSKMQKTFISHNPTVYVLTRQYGGITVCHFRDMLSIPDL